MYVKQIIMEKMVKMNFAAIVSLVLFALIIDDLIGMVGQYGDVRISPYSWYEVIEVFFSVIGIFVLGKFSKFTIINK